MSEWINQTFSGPLTAFFRPINNLFVGVDPFWWIASAAGLFTLTMLWVCFVLKKEYVNVDQPKPGLLYDLRVWTVLSMLPHVLIYIFFN